MQVIYAWDRNAKYRTEAEMNFFDFKTSYSASKVQTV
jgi:hypothetical protein